MRFTLVLLVVLGGCGRRPPEPAPRVEVQRERAHGLAAARREGDAVATAAHRAKRRHEAVPEPDPLGGVGFDDLDDLAHAASAPPADVPAWDEDDPLDDDLPPLDPLPG